MKLHKWGLLAYPKARKHMDLVHNIAQKDKQNHLIFTQHPNIFTVGRDSWDETWPVDSIKSDRGGSITCHSPGQNIYYFCFQAPSPPHFFRKVLTAYTNFFQLFGDDFRYDKQNPGFYRENRKIASLGFRYQNGVSLHGVAVNVDVDLAFHGQVNPCNLQGIIPTSLQHEGIDIDSDDVNTKILSFVMDAFDESL